jgi:hypothetical protein
MVASNYATAVFDIGFLARNLNKCDALYRCRLLSGIGEGKHYTQFRGINLRRIARPEEHHHVFALPKKTRGRGLQLR